MDEGRVLQGKYEMCDLCSNADFTLRSKSKYVLLIELWRERIGHGQINLESLHKNEDDIK